MHAPDAAPLSPQMRHLIVQRREFTVSSPRTVNPEKGTAAADDDTADDDDASAASSRYVSVIQRAQFGWAKKSGSSASN